MVYVCEPLEGLQPFSPKVFVGVFLKYEVPESLLRAVQFFSNREVHLNGNVRWGLDGSGGVPGGGCVQCHSFFFLSSQCRQCSRCNVAMFHCSQIYYGKHKTTNCINYYTVFVYVLFKRV